MAIRYPSLARWSLIGVPARAISSAAAATTSRVHGRPASACSAA